MDRLIVFKIERLALWSFLPLCRLCCNQISLHQIQFFLLFQVEPVHQNGCSRITVTRQCINGIRHLDTSALLCQFISPFQDLLHKRSRIQLSIQKANAFLLRSARYRKSFHSRRSDRIADRPFPFCRHDATPLQSLPLHYSTISSAVVLDLYFSLRANTIPIVPGPE